MSNGVPLPGIEHVIVLMLENRSFDNVLGGLYRDLTEQGLYRGLRGTETNPFDPAPVAVFQGAAQSPTWTMPYPDPGELYTDMVLQIFAANNSNGPANMLGFAASYSLQGPSADGKLPVPGYIMQYYSDQTMPVSSYLAQQYAVCDCWFAAGPVQTIANRIFTHCGTPGKYPDANNPGSYLSRLNNPDYTSNWYDPLTPPISDTTIFELLDGPCLKKKASILNWKVYYHDAPLSVLCKYVYDHWDYDDFSGGNVWGFEPSEFDPGFASDVANGLLPKYTYIEPRYTDHSSDPFESIPPNSNHPGGAGVDWDDPNGQSEPPAIDVRYGEILLCEVYSILLNNPEVFEKTLLIVTYDEHGGLYDHIPPPCACSPFQTAVENFNYDRYGVRVPAILINPFIAPGTIYPARKAGDKIPDPPFDHTSILSTLMAQFGLSGSLSPRVDNAPQLRGLIPTALVKYERPPLVCPEPPAPAPLRQTPRKRPRPQPQAHTLAGALGPLYQHVERSKLIRRLRSSGGAIR